MFEVSFSSEQHRDAEFVAFPYRIFIPDGSARLDNGFDTIPGRESDAVVEREEGVGCKN